jgi:uncharacterized membrane protein YdbT with pleckstrin-like domain
MMSYVKRVLQPSETVLVEGHLHWVLYLPAIGLLLTAGVAFFVGRNLPDSPWVATIANGFSIAFLALAAVFAVKTWFESFITEIAVTNIRVIYRKGFITRQTSEMNMDKVESVTVAQSIAGRLLGYGTVQVHGTGEGSIEQLHYIADPIELRNAIVAK